VHQQYRKNAFVSLQLSSQLRWDHRRIGSGTPVELGPLWAIACTRV